MNIQIIGDTRYAFRDPETHKYPWWCCQKCGNAEIGIIGRVLIWAGVRMHVCLPRSHGGYYVGNVERENSILPSMYTCMGNDDPPPHIR